ncbi:Adenylate kinase isoenzyme 1 [Cichlidogyrus casuarinus]|uniref:adenylate kinase n=1 Tax=Cichlidogyrus casuarinus TaxID=1844966 RepID=A0ABD2QLH8_9PLAT
MAAQLKDAQVVFVLGGPGSGKGTQCAKLVEKYGFNHLSSGDLLRDEVNSGSPLGNELKAKMEAGELVSLEKVLELLKNAMVKLIEKNKGFLIDGYPRELEQGTKFEAEVAPCQLVVAFDVSEETMKARLLERGKTSGRADDNEQTIIKRFETFKNLTKPVIDHYKKAGKVVEVDASGAIDAIFATVCSELESRVAGLKK